MMHGDQALSNAVRLSEAAEMETDRDRMNCLTNLAQVWTDIAAICYDRESEDA